MLPPKPEPGYTGESRTYAHGYTVRTRVHQTVKARYSSDWVIEYQYDVFHEGDFVATATSLRLAEKYIAENSPYNPDDCSRR